MFSSHHFNDPAFGSPSVAGSGTIDPTKQPLSAALSEIAGLTPSNDDILQRKAGVWANRTIAQVKSDLGLQLGGDGTQYLNNQGAYSVPAGGGGVALGETISTAYRGDRGKIAYDHSQVAHDKTLVGLANVPNVDATNPGNIVQTASYRFATDAEKATWNGKQSALVSGTNIKTINGISVLGAGDITISGGGGVSLGETDSTAYRGDRGKIAYDHSQVVHDKTLVGLANVDNTSDANKPVSTAQQTALDLKANLASPTFSGTVGGITAAMVGLANVNNTSDANKPVSTAQQTALNLKANLASPTFTGTVSGITAAMVGLANVNNTSDASKPVSTAQQAALDLKANLISPSLVTPNLGVPASGTLTNCAGLPVGSGISGLASGIAAFLATSSSANFATALTDEIGTGKVLFSDPVINPQAGTSYTLVASDLGKIIEFSNASAITVTVPTSLGSGFNCIIVQLGAGQVTLSPSSTTLRAKNGLKTSGQYAGLSIFPTSTANTFVVTGDTAA